MAKVGKWEKVEPTDRRNHSSVYLQIYEGGSIGIAAEMFDQPDVYQMIVMEPGQLKKLADLLKDKK